MRQGFDVQQMAVASCAQRSPNQNPFTMLLQQPALKGPSASCLNQSLQRHQPRTLTRRSARRADVATRAYSSDLEAQPGNGIKNVVVVGGGWAGFGAVKHLAEQGYNVTLLDAQPNPGGLSTGFRTKNGRAVEAGMKGFWYSYSNIFRLIESLGLPEWPLTDYTTSGFWSPRGLVTEAPVFSKLPRLPTLIGQFVHTAPLFWSISLQDRLTMLPFLASFVDFNSDEETFKKYDSMSAYELFRKAGVSKEAYQEFLRPTLLVGLFAPPESISAAVMLETLYFYALAHQNDFDVCWARGSISELIFSPLVQRIQASGGQVLGNKLVTRLISETKPGGVEEITAVEAVDRATGETVVYPCDAVVFSVGVSAMQKLVSANPCLGAHDDFRRIMNLKALDVIATRIWYDRRVPTRYPANVLSGFEPAAGATFFNLTDLHDEYKAEPGTVITADYYNASALLPLSDDEVIRRTQRHIETCEPAFREANVVDSVVLRYPKAVTHFSVGSYPDRPYQATSIPNAFIAGDYVKGLAHGANGLSQERAYVTGLTAANLVIARLGYGSPATILDVEPDEPHIAAAKELVKQARGAKSALGIKSPFL